MYGESIKSLYMLATHNVAFFWITKWTRFKQKFLLLRLSQNFDSARFVILMQERKETLASLLILTGGKPRYVHTTHSQRWKCSKTSYSLSGS